MSSWYAHDHFSICFYLTNGILKLQLEYDNTEGMILLSELSRRRIRSVQKLIRVGRNEVVVVLRVDKEKGASGRVLLHFSQTEGGGIQGTSISQNAVSPPKTS